MKKIITGVIVAAMFSTAARANEGNLVHIDSTPICNFVVTNQSVPNGGEVRLRARAGFNFGHTLTKDNI